MTKTKQAISLAAITLTILFTAPIMSMQSVYADLVSASPENIVTASGQRFHSHFWDDHSHPSHCHQTDIFGTCINNTTHHFGNCHWSAPSASITSSHLFNNYNLEVKALKDHTINVASSSGLGNSPQQRSMIPATASSSMPRSRRSRSSSIKSE